MDRWIKIIAAILAALVAFNEATKTPSGSKLDALRKP